MNRSSASQSEVNLLSLRSSQYSNTVAYIVCVLLIWLIVPIFCAIWIYLKTKSRVMAVTTQRILIEEGVLGKKRSTLEMYRVTDVQSGQSFLQRMVGVGDVTVISTDKTSPVLVLRSIPDPFIVGEKIREVSENRKQERGVKFLDAV